MIVCWSYCRPLAAAASALAERTREAPDRRPPRPSSDAPTDSLFTRYRNFIPSRRRSRLLRRLTRILSPSFSAHPIRVHRVGLSSTFARSPMHLLKPACRFTCPSRAIRIKLMINRGLLLLAIRINESASHEESPSATASISRVYA